MVVVRSYGEGDMVVDVYSLEPCFFGVIFHFLDTSRVCSMCLVTDSSSFYPRLSWTAIEQSPHRDGL